ncbi:aminotransferase class I/II-fold pyridoxal phosphate-dependent enzyme [Alkalicoccus urumqiensis]|uniref:Aminotransferase n=1 Tax=Alkalicoccus urumqiensis TaxID=1548213 RepID=A0A2P6MKS9_ALKUR|nr:aminotransferase class I/II-fold pyridoxal phosphate-dependent enzyme [Alkalicoccus urumqiensis]PRO66888.1 aromatic amino acid aminotransferase [Alkalicoccus urumqiensis]
MSLHINPLVENIEISGIRKFFQRVQQFPDAVQLTIGQPDFPTPGHIGEAAVQAVDEGRTTYTPNAGTPELRKAASSWAEKRLGISYSWEEVLVTVGASQAIDITMRTILEPGDEVIIPAPVYPAYAPIITQCGAEVVYVDTRETDFVLTPEQLEKHLTSSTKAVLLPYPSNPTGVALTKPQLNGLYEVLREKEIFVVCDEIYSELIYDGRHISMGSMSGMKEKTIVINGVSKSHAMTGWRIGFLFAPSWLAEQMIKVLQYNVSCASSISQAAALSAVTDGIDDPEAMRDVFKQRRDYVISFLEELSIPVVRPQGALYVFPDITGAGLSSEAFAVRLLEEAGVAVVPGTAFSSFGEGYVRMSYACGEEDLEKAAQRIGSFWKKITRSE